MPTIPATVSANSVLSVTINNPAGHLVVTQLGGASAPTYPIAVTTDGSTPVLPPGSGAGSKIDTNQKFVPGIAGGSTVFLPQYQSGQPVAPITVKLLSAANAQVEIAW